MHPAKKVLEDYLDQGKTVAYDNVADNTPSASSSQPTQADVFKRLFPTSGDDEEDKKKQAG